MAETKNFWSEKCHRSSCAPCKHRNSRHLTERRPMYNFIHRVTETRDLRLASHTLLYQAGGNSGACLMYTVGAAILCDQSLREQPGHRFYTTRPGNQSNYGTLFSYWGFLTICRKWNSSSGNAQDSAQSLYDLMVMANTWDVVWFLGQREIQHKCESWCPTYRVNDLVVRAKLFWLDLSHQL